MVTPDEGLAGVCVVEKVVLGVLGDVHQNWPWTTRICDMKSFGDGLRYLIGLRNLYIPFGHGHGGIDHVRFLEGIGTEQVKKDLSGNAHNRS